MVVVKATFMVARDGSVERASAMEPIALTDVYRGEPGASSQLYESEVLLRKPSTDVLLNGHAYAPEGSAVQQLDISFQVGDVTKQISVFGDRVWEKGLLGLRASAPRAFERMPLIYERAFGPGDGNPVGVGFHPDPAKAVGSLLPNLEAPGQRISRCTDTVAPMGVGVISKHWEPRRTWAGTCDERWLAERMPLWPEDLDPRFFQAAPADQVSREVLRGGEPVLLQHLTPEGPLAFRLPRVELAFTTALGKELIQHRAQLDTVILEPDIPRVLLVWHTMLSCHRKKFELKWTEIKEKTVVPKGRRQP